MFQHDTSRLLDPQAHIHVVVAAITQMADGAWKRSGTARSTSTTR
jgi:conjugative relaxase-like TrwC/TraI family protein